MFNGNTVIESPYLMSYEFGSLTLSMVPLMQFAALDIGI